MTQSDAPNEQTNMKTDFKELDTLNRRQKERPLNLGIHGISLARYFTIGDQSNRYTLTERPMNGDYMVHAIDDERKLIGYAKPDRNKIIMSVRRDGIDWVSKIPFSQIHIYGKL